MLWPVALSPEYAFDCIPKISSVLDAKFMHTVILYGALLALIARGLYTNYFKQTPLGHHPHDALIRIMVWLVIPFVPASGIFLRLGTLLAERLLYIPSLGFCMLLAFLVHHLCHHLSSLFLAKKSSADSIISFPTALYWGIISSITLYYISRTRSYNLAWRNDESLFLYNYNVCPRSAKLNLQLAKLHLNRQDYTAATKFIETAKTIDPDFCDVGYQEALLHLLHHQNLDKAIDAAIRNLQCIYTSKYSLELITKVWDQQLSNEPFNYHLLEAQARGAMHAQLPALAAKKYLSGMRLAHSLKKYSESIRFAEQTESLTTGLEVEMQSLSSRESEQKHALQSLICQIFLSTSKLRLDIVAADDYGKTKRDELRRKAIDVLYAAGSTKCIIIDQRSLKLIATPALEAMNLLQASLLQIGSGNDDVVAMESIANYSEASARILFLIDATRDRTEASYSTSSSEGGNHPAANEWSEKAMEMAVNAMQTRYNLGKRYFQVDNYHTAATNFIHATYLYVDEKTALSNICAGPFLEKGITEIAGRSVLDWCLRTMELFTRINPIASMLQGHPYTLLLYWYAHAVAGQSDFLNDQRKVEDVIDILTLILAQSNIPDSITSQASKQLQSLESFLRQNYHPS
jgi:hypothetical protein